MEAEGIDWDTILNLFPTEDTEEHQEQRNEMWFLFNVNENPGLTIFELEKGIVQMTQTGDIFDSERAINDAFEHAKNAKLDKAEGMEEMLDKDQFNLFLRSIRMIFEFYQAFNWIDSDGDHIITKTEFTSQEVEKVIESWLGEDSLGGSQFDSIDLTNKNGEEKITFCEFLDWALKRNIIHQGSFGVAVAE
ncbi:uncharacterized protein LOC111705996 [Eurytemora carolleeae]|uniref:uncharacterized protein LOC111705996 n=1 Tax=Eurytemora carolleeae TaxID=1294199 RepID=UPI000C780FB0|nr:uncharacterized protein LOC111705996 [Eurytemora carolleeae]|eukprot:XP_023334495.1 uncharacterized protein LOC111705996 [Eurytemora affinis]